MDKPNGTRADATTVTQDDPFPFGAIAPPIYQTSLFTFPDYATMLQRFRGESDRQMYSRVGNPSVSVIEDKIAELECADAARAYNSGMAAISAVLFSLARTGDRIVSVRHIYPDAYRLFNVLGRRMGITVDYVDGHDLAAVRAALPGARLLYLESPTSWTFETLDIRLLAEAAAAAGAHSVIDNSWATPIFQKPLTQGVDLVVHSASKYLNGHSDTVAGVVAGRADLIGQLDEIATPYLGAKLAPVEAWLLTRGVRTLDIRMRQHERSGVTIARRLAEHPAVVDIHHPALRDSPSSSLLGSSSLFGFELRDDVDIPAFCDFLNLFKLGVSWGGYESLVLPAMITLQQNAGPDGAARPNPVPNSAIDFGVSPRLVRLHVGLEDVDALWTDLRDALDRASP